MENVETPWLTADQVRAYLGGVSERTLKRYRDALGLPVHYITTHKTPRYHRDEVDTWIRDQSRDR